MIAKWLAQSRFYPTDSSWQRAIEWPAWLVVLVIAAIACWLYLNARSGRPSLSWSSIGVAVGLRLAAITLLLLSLLGWYRRSIEIEPPEMAICVDLSESMRQPVSVDGSGLPQSRLDVLLGPLDNEGLRASLAAKWKVRWFIVGDELRELEEPPLRQPLNGQAEQRSSRLGDSLFQLLDRTAGRPLSAVVFLSDGLTTEGRELQQFHRAVQRRGVPVFTVDLAQGFPALDAEVLPIQVASRAIVGESLVFRVPIRARELAGEQLIVTLRDIDSNLELATQTWIPDGPRSATELRFSQAVERAGALNYEFRVTTPERDVNLSNDVQRVQVQAVQLQHRVLLVAGKPEYEYRFLKHTIERSIRDVNSEQLSPYDLSVLLQESLPEFSETDSTALNVFPVSTDALAEYDVIILLDPLTMEQDQARGLSKDDFTHLQEYVESRAGNVIFIAGADFVPQAWSQSPLESLFPALASDFQTWKIPVGGTEGLSVERTPLGRRAPQLQLEQVPSTRAFEWNGEFQLEQAVTPSVLRPGTRSLLETPDRLDQSGRPASLLSLRFVGSGIAVYQGFAESYRLRFRRDDQVLNTYWGQWIQFLAKRKWLSQQAWRELRTEELRYREGDRVTILASIADNGLVDEGVPWVSVWSDSGFDLELPLRPGDDSTLEFKGTIDDLPIGAYTVTLTTRDGDQPIETRFDVIQRRSESEVLRVDNEALKKLAEVSGGQQVKADQLDEMPRWLPAGSPVIVGQRPDRPFWDQKRFAIFIGFSVLTLLSIEWFLRNRMG